jgi:hypothetical protein
MDQDIEIIQALHSIAQQGKSVSLITVYKTLPLLFDALIEGFEGDSVHLMVHKYQWAASRRVWEAFIQSDLLLELIKASSVVVNPNKPIVTLADFEYAKISIVRRSLVRVQPDLRLPVILLVNESAQPAELADISTGGFSVYAKSEIMHALIDANSGPGSGRVEVLVKFPGENSPLVKINCAICNVMQTADINRYRVGLQVFPDKKTGPLIAQYVANRQTVILRELEVLAVVDSRE